MWSLNGAQKAHQDRDHRAGHRAQRKRVRFVSTVEHGNLLEQESELRRSRIRAEERDDEAVRLSRHVHKCLAQAFDSTINVLILVCPFRG